MKSKSQNKRVEKYPKTTKKFDDRKAAPSSRDEPVFFFFLSSFFYPDKIAEKKDFATVFLEIIMEEKSFFGASLDSLFPSKILETYCARITIKGNDRKRGRERDKK